MASKKILILSHKPPYPKIDGGSIAIAQVLEVLLEQGHHVTFLCMETDKHPANSITRTNLSFKVIYVNTKLKIAQLSLPKMELSLPILVCNANHKIQYYPVK